MHIGHMHVLICKFDTNARPVIYLVFVYSSRHNSDRALKHRARQWIFPYFTYKSMRCTYQLGQFV